MNPTFLNRFKLFFYGNFNYFHLGECYEQGRHVEQDMEIALFCYQRAARSGNRRAYFKIGEIYERQNQHKKALRAYLDGAIRNDTDSLNQLIKKDQDGDGIATYYMGIVCEYKKEWKKAEEFYKKAGNNGDGTALYRLGTLYSSDRISPTDQRRIIIRKSKENALYWYKKSAESDSKYGLNILIELHTTEAKAAFYIGEFYEFGKGSVHENLLQAIDYYKKASVLGYLEANMKLGHIYSSGYINKKGIRVKNINKSCQYYFKACQQKSNRAKNELEKILTNNTNALYEYQLAKICEKEFKDKISAIKWYIRAEEHGKKIATREIERLVELESAIAFFAAEHYEQDNFKKATNYYAIAMRNGHSAASQKLELLIESGNADAQYAKAYEYFHKKGKLHEAVELSIKAAEQQHSKAINYLENTEFNIEIYLKIARQYEKGENVQKNIERAIKFYEKAGRLKSTEALLHLGELYRIGSDEVGKDINKSIKYYEEASQLGSIQASYWLGICYENATDIKDNFKLAFNCYLVAAEGALEKSLKALECLTKESQNASFEYQLGNFYYYRYNEVSKVGSWKRKERSKLKAAKYYKKAEKRNHKGAVIKIYNLVRSDAEFSNIIAQLYEQEDHQEAMIYYVIAMRKGHKEATQKIEALINEENADAQYAKAYEYYHYKGDFLAAAKLCIQAAEKQHKPAADYLRKTRFNDQDCLAIARIYEKKENDPFHMQNAFEFYEKASALGNTEAAFHLGQLYQIDHQTIKKDVEKSFQYYLQAAKSGCHSALAPLERLGTEVHSEFQLELGKLFSASSFHNTEKANYWYQIADESGNTRVKIFLN